MDTFDLPFSDTASTRLSADEVDAFARRTGWIDDIAVIAPATTVIERRPLSWWPEHALIVARDPGWAGHAAAWVLPDGGRLVRLDGSSPPIHGLNRNARLEIARSNVLAYVGFFCTFVQGEAQGVKSPFLPVQSLEDGLLPDIVDPAAIAGFMRKPEVLKEEDSADSPGSSEFHVETLIYHSDALFLSNFLVKASGMVEMLEDEPLKGDLGASVRLPLTFTEAPSEAEREGGSPPS